MCPYVLDVFQGPVRVCSGYSAGYQSYRVGELQDVGPVGERAAVTGLVHQGAGQEHGAQVVPI